MWKSDETVTVFLSKNSDGVAKAAIKIGGYSGSITLPKKPPTVKIEYPVISKTLYNQTDRDDIDKDDCIYPDGDAFLLPSTAKVTVLSKLGGDRAVATLKSASPLSACMHTHTQTGAVGKQVWINAELSATARKISVVP